MSIKNLVIITYIYIYIYIYIYFEFFIDCARSGHLPLPSLAIIFPYKDRITELKILSLYGKVRVRENPFPGIFYAVKMVLVTAKY